MLIYLFDLIRYIFIENWAVANVFSVDGPCGYKFIRYFAFVQCFFPSDNWGLWNNRYALWTMSSFAFFYLIVPVIWKYIKKFEIAVLILLGLLFSRGYIAGVLLQILKDYPQEAEIEYFAMMNPLCEMYCFFFGICIFYAIRDKKETYYAIILVGLLMLTEFTWYSYEMVLALLILIIVKNPIKCNAMKTESVIRTFANGTFALYLCHPIILKGIHLILGNVYAEESGIMVAISLLTSISLSFLVYYLVEKPLEQFLMTKWDRWRAVYSQN